MFCRAFYLRGREHPIVLQFKSRSAARENRAETEAGSLCRWGDDYGRQLAYDPADLMAWMVIDSEGEAEGNSEIALIGARANARVQTKAQSDPAIKFAQGGRSGLLG